MTEPVAIFPPPHSALGLKSWVRELAQAMAVTVRPPPLPDMAALSGNNRPVLILPGFGSGDWSNRRMALFLGKLGYHVAMPGIPFNPGPARFVMERIERVFQELSAQAKVSLVGVSLGGVLARDLARRYPEKVDRVVTLCSPVRFPVVTPLQPFARLLSPLHLPQWTRRRHEIEQPLKVPVTAIHVSQDGIVEREQCWLAPSPGAHNVVVTGRHLCVQMNPLALRLVAESLDSANC